MRRRRDKFTEQEILLARCAITCGLPHDKMRADSLAAFIAWLDELVGD